MNLTPAQQAVFDEAKARLERYPWFRGVCMDSFPSDEKCRNQPKQAIESVIDETALWDRPITQ